MRIAPSVPPKTIKAAVGWITWPRFPPSSIKPNRMPPIASTRPPRVALSTRLLFLAQWVVGALKDGRKAGTVVPPEHDRLQHRAAELHHSFENVLGTLPNDNFFATHQSDDGIGGLLDELDQVGIDGQRVIVEVGELDHVWLLTFDCTTEEGPLLIRLHQYQ